MIDDGFTGAIMGAAVLTVLLMFSLFMLSISM
jgi:hypothetical protein